MPVSLATALLVCRFTRRGGMARAIVPVILLSAGCTQAIKPAPPSPPPPLPQRPPALNLGTIVDLYHGVGAERAMYRAHDECINFFVDVEAEGELLGKGVDSGVIESLKSDCVDLTTNVAEQNTRRSLVDSIGVRPAAAQYYAAARAYMRAQRFGAAEGEIHEAIRIVNNRSDYYLLLATAYSYQAKCEIAARAFETVTLLDRNLGYIAYARTGRCFQLASEWDKAYVAYQRAFDYPPAPGGQEWLRARLSELSRHDDD